MINPIQLTRNLFIVICLLLGCFSTGLAQSAAKDKAAEDLSFENILIVSPSHGDVSVVETDEEIQFSIWISSFLPIKLVEISRERNTEKGEQIEDHRRNGQTIFFNKDEQSDTSWFVTFNFKPFVYSKDEAKRGFKEEQINVFVMTEDKKYEGNSIKERPSSTIKKFTIRSKGQLSNEEENFENAITEDKPNESEVGMVERVPILTVPKDRSLYYPVYFSLDNHSNLTKASSNEQKYSGLSPALNVAVNYQYDFGALYSKRDKFKVAYLQSENRFPSDMNGYDTATENTYKYYEVSLSQLELSMLSEFDQFDMEISLGQNVIQRFGEMQFFDSSKADESNTTISVVFGRNGLNQSNPLVGSSQNVETKKSQEVQKLLDEKDSQLMARKNGYFVSAGYYLQTRESITDENSIKAAAGTSDAELIQQYLRSGTVSTLSVFGGYRFSFGELSGRIDQVDNSTNGNFMATSEQEMGLYWEMWLDTVDLYTGVNINNISFNTAREEDDGVAISNTLTTWTLGSMVRLTETLRLVFEFSSSSQESKFTDYSYSSSIFSVALGWTS